MTGYLLNILLILSLSIGLNSKVLNDCKGLSDGRFILEFTNYSIEKPSIVVVSKDRFSRCCSIGDTLTGRINRIAECYFLFEYDNRILDTVGFQGLLSKSFGDACFEIKGMVGDTILFRTTYTANLRITINEGRFIRLR